MLRLLAALAALVVGCGASAPANLLMTYQLDRCHPAPNAGQLVADPQFGTVLLEAPSGPRIPVAWPSGYSGRYSSGEIEVLAPDGSVVAVTGRQYELIGIFGDVGGANVLEACGAFPQ